MGLIFRYLLNLYSQPSYQNTLGGAQQLDKIANVKITDEDVKTIKTKKIQMK